MVFFRFRPMFQGISAFKYSEIIMHAIKSILVVVDPTVERDFAIDRARQIAKAAAAKVNLFINSANSLNQHTYMYEGIDPDFFLQQRKLFTSHNRHILEKIAAEFAAQNISATTDFEEKHHLAESIIEQTRKVQADLVIKSTHHHNLIQRSLITNTDWRLIRKCPAPLLLVKPRAWAAAGNIVTAVDPLHAKSEQSRLDHELLETTEFLASSLQQEPHVFHSYFPFVSTLLGAGAEFTEGMARIREHHADKIRKLLANHRIADKNIELSRGELAPTLIDYLLATNANLLVIGALSRSVMERAIVGDTAEKILENSPCDVLVLKPRHKP